MNENSMHITDQEMDKYVNNQLSSFDRQRVELEIQLCDQCLERFMYWTSQMKAFEQTETVSTAFIEEAMDQIQYQINNQYVPKKQRWIQRPFVQVVVAASVTLLLVGTGVLSQLSSSLASYEQQAQQGIERTKNISIEHSNTDSTSGQRWLGKTVEWIDQLKEHRFQE